MLVTVRDRAQGVPAPEGAPIGAPHRPLISPAPEPSALAQVDAPGNPGPEGLDSGPKFKLRPPTPAVAHPQLIPQPAPPAVHAAPAPPGPMIAASPLAAPAPIRSARSPGENSSIEERLARVERMLESLLAQKKMKTDGEFDVKWPEAKMDLKDLDKLKERGLIDQKELEKIKEQARREAARATEEVRRAARENQKAGAEQKRQQRGDIQESSQRQIEALRHQLEHLERQKEALGRQIERLEHDRQKFEGKEPNDLQPKGSKDEGQREEGCVTKEQNTV